MSPPDVIFNNSLREYQQIAPGLFIALYSRGKKGTGKVWNPCVVIHNPHNKEAPWRISASIRGAQQAYSKRKWKVFFYQYPEFTASAYFEDFHEAKRFLVMGAIHFWGEG